MLDIEEITRAIKELENQETTFSNCEKLSYLYTILDHHKVDDSKETSSNNNTVVVKEYSDILPSYTSYCNIKRKYQLNEITQEAVIDASNNMCREIEEFLKILYTNTTCPMERESLSNMVKSLSF